MTFTVTDEDLDGTLEVEKVITKPGEADGEGNATADIVETIEYVNHYEAEGGETLEGVKKLVDNEGNEMSLTGRTYTFSLTAAANNPTSGIKESTLKATATNDASGKIDFGGITFNKTGVWALQ